MTKMPMRSKIQRRYLAALMLGLTLSLSVAAVAARDRADSLEPGVSGSGSIQELESGEEIYRERCSFCHGLEGDGNGPVAEYLHPRPRDFTSGIYKLRTTASGTSPTDTDLIRTVSEGIPGTAMPAWKGTLTQEEIVTVVGYIKSFAAEEFEFYPPEPVEVPDPPRRTEALVQRGADLYQEVQCWKCHGQAGRADGESALELEDESGRPIRAADLTRPWRYKGGADVQSIFTRFSTGMDGSPMPSFVDSLPDPQDRWALAAYVESLQQEPASEETVLRALRLGGDLPIDPADPRWEDAPALRIPLSGQIITRPRWQNHSVDLVTLRAVYNEEQIAFHLSWSDPFQNITHSQETSSLGVVDDTYVPASAELMNPQLNNYRDAALLQFPVRIPETARKPHFFLGQTGQPVNLWHWRADMEAIEEENATGWEVEPSVQGAESQGVGSRSVWQDGQWQLVLIRSRFTNDPADDIQFEEGKFIPIAVHVWDGSNSEVGLARSISSWYSVLLEGPTPVRVYAYTVLGVLVAGGVEWWAVRRLRRQQK